MVLRPLMSPTCRAALAAALLLATGLPARADVTLAVGALVETRTTRHALDITLDGGRHQAQGDRGVAVPTAGVSADTASSFLGRVSSEARVESRYTVVGLADRAPVTFTWQFASGRSWNPMNASLGVELGAGIFSRGIDLYIHQIGWATSFVDGPPAMGDFAGSTHSPLRVTGQAGAEGLFSTDLPAGDWDGQGTRLARTTWLLGPDGFGDLWLAAQMGAGGDLQASAGVSLLQLTVPQAGHLAPGGAYLLLDNGQRLAITALAVPEPGAAALLLAGLAAFGVARGGRRL